MNEEIKQKFDSYPPVARDYLHELRHLIFKVAQEDGVGEIIESIKWGEASYTSKIGSPIRIDWKEKYPDHVSIFVNCNTKLIETFKEVYGEALTYVGKREIAVALPSPLPISELKGCISMALRYHKLKHLPLLGA